LLRTLWVYGEVKPITEVQELLEGISEEEKEVLQKLFTLTQEIEEMEREELRISGDIKMLLTEIAEKEQLIKKQQERYDSQLEVLKKVLIGYQRSGPASYLDTLLSAGDLRTFVRSINIIRDLTSNVGELLASLEEGKETLKKENEKLKESVIILEAKKEELKEPIRKKQQLLKEQNTYLDSLKGQRALYEEHLANLEVMWDDSKTMFSQLVSEFTRIIGEGNITAEDLNLSFGFTGMKGAIYEETFNEILKEHSTLPELLFHFQSDRIEIEVPDKKITLSGTFVIEDETALRLNVEEGSFYEMPLEQESIEELFKEGYLLLDFKEMTQGISIDFIINTVTSKDGVLEFTIKPEF
jgi:peptidoglycan hydrolase CwlO-like protein